MIEQAIICEKIVALTQARGTSASICPSEVARALIGDGDWRVVMPGVRRAAIALAKSGAIEITRKGKSVDPDAFKGVYRLRLRDPSQ